MHDCTQDVFRVGGGAVFFSEVWTCLGIYSVLCVRHISLIVNLDMPLCIGLQVYNSKNQCGFALRPYSRVFARLLSGDSAPLGLSSAPLA